MTLLLAEDGEFPDVENILLDMLSAVPVDGVPIGENTGTRTPADVSSPYFHVMAAIGAGGMNPAAWSDTATLYVAAWSDLRSTSQQMVKGLRAIVADYCDGGDYKGVFLDRMWESGRPGNLPVEDEDDRRVETGVSIRMRRHNGPAVSA